MPLTITPNLTNVYLDQADTSFTRTHTVAQAAIITDTDFFRQGSSSVAWQTKATGADQGLAFDSGASNINLSNTILRVWGQFNEANKYDTKANGGVRVFVSDGAFGADNWGEWYVDGSDTLTADWRNYVIDTTTPFDRTSATAPTMTTIRRIGFSTNMITKPAKVQNVHIDAIRYGRGLTVTGTVSETGKGWQEIVTADENISNQYGVLQRTPSGVLVLTGEIIIGDATGSLTTNFSDIQNEKIVVPIAFTGNLEGLVNIIVRGNATGTTDFRLGSVVGTGDDRQGILGGIIFTNGDQFGFDSETDTADIDTCYLYGVTFEGARNVKLLGSTTQKAIGCTFNGCGEVQPNNAEFLNNTIIGPSPNLGIEMINGHQIKQVSCVAGSTDDQPVAKAVQFDVSATPVHSTVDYTTQINNSTANNVVPFPAADAIGDYFAFGFPAKFNTLKINTGTARSGGSLNWRYWNGSSWTTFTPTTDNTNTLSTTGLQTVTLWATPPAAWQPTTLIPDSGFRREKKQMFYISSACIKNIKGEGEFHIHILL